MDRPSVVIVTTILITVTLVYTDEDWANCAPCRCSWVNGRKNADCKRGPNAIFSSIPTNLSSEIRSIDFTDQQLFELQKNAFFSVNLGDLQKVKLINCQLKIIDKFAFSKMLLLIELDLSRNEISKLDNETFRDNKRLRVLMLNHNKLETLEDHLFENLTFLQKVELNDNRIFSVGKKAFVNTPTLQYIMLNSNKLTYMDISIVENLKKLSSLSLHNNSWICDCRLKAFRDLTIERNLFTLPTECAEPERLKDRSWSELSSEDFACRPEIIYPANTGLSIEAQSENITLSCMVRGNPQPDVNWVYKNGIIDANPRRPGGQRYSFARSFVGVDTYWFNLTIFSINYNDGGEYKCAAKNPGGIQEKNITLKVSSGYPGGVFSLPGSGMKEMWTVILFVILGVVICALFVIVLLWCCFCRQKNNRHMKNNSMSPNGDISLEGTAAEMEKSLITAVNPVEKPPRQYPPSVASGVTEVSEVNRTLLDNDSVFAPGDDDSRSFDFVEAAPRKSHTLLDAESMRSERPYPPDLLSFPARAIQISPAGSSASTVPDHTRLPAQHGPQSPINSPLYDSPGLYRTLPYSRSHSPFTSPLTAPVIVPRSANKGYVTMPRRNRVPSWSSAPPTTPLIAEPVYDNLGLRTTAQGSSMLSLNKVGEMTPRPRPIVTTPNQQTPVKCLPINEQEMQPFKDISSPTSLNFNPELGKRDSWMHMYPDGSAQGSYDADTRRPSNSSLPAGSESRKVPPRPPPKPKKAVTTGPLFEDEGEDGTEV